MIDRLSAQARRDPFGSKINRDHSPVLAYGLPWLTILAASLTPLLPVIAPAPVVPPLAFLMLLGWRLLRPGLLPLWAGVPLGLFDDLYSGQPLGSAVLLFSLTLIALDLVELRFPWRNFLQNWLIASGFIAAYLLLALLFSGAPFSLTQAGLIVPQLLLSLVLFPIVMALVSALDRVRLFRVRRIG